MSKNRLTTRVLKGKYRITQNTFVVCYLNVLEATDQEIRTFIRLKKNAFTRLPIGTHVYFNAETLNKGGSKGELSIFSVVVKQIEEINGQPLHVCTSVQKEIRANLRSQERREVDFELQLANSSSVFIAKNGNNKGLTLHFTAKRAMMGLMLDQFYDFSVQFKGEEYILPGQIKHIQYDWKSHEHLIGVHFPKLDTDQDIVLNLLVDPDYTIPISNRQVVNTSTGKISAPID